MTREEQKLVNKFLMDMLQSESRIFVPAKDGDGMELALKISDIMTYWVDFREKIESLQDKKDA